MQAMPPMSADADRIYRKKEYTPAEQEQRVKKKADRNEQKEANPVGYALGKKFDVAVANVNPSMEEIKSIVEGLRQAKDGPTTKHLNRAITYIKVDHLVELVQMLLSAGATPTAQSVEKVEHRIEENPD